MPHKGSLERAPLCKLLIQALQRCDTVVLSGVANALYRLASSTVVSPRGPFQVARNALGILAAGSVQLLLALAAPWSARATTTADSLPGN